MDEPFQNSCSADFRLDTWSSCDMGRLGYYLGDTPESHYVWRECAIHTPIRVEKFDNSTVK